MKTKDIERFWKKVDRKEDGCWEWQAGSDKDGYGLFHIGENQVRAHRFSWKMENGEIPEGMFVCHRCDNPPCIRPDHLFLGTPADNARDRDAKGRQVHLKGKNHPMYGRTGEKHPMFGKGHLVSGEKNGMFGRTGEKSPMFGRTGEKSPMFGKGHLVSGEKNGMFGKGHLVRGEKNGMFGKGHLQQGKSNPSAKLDETSVRIIRTLHMDFDFKQRELADLYSVNPSCISAIVNRKRWKHI